MLSTKLREIILNKELDDKLLDIYLDSTLLDYNRNRYLALVDRFEDVFGVQDVRVLSAPGRSEVCGNHTDHQHGKVLACAINLDAIAVTSKSEKIKVYSDEFDIPEFSPDDLEIDASEKGTSIALVKGVLAYLKNRGFQVGGFNAMITSDVLIGAGMSSSAAFEILIGVIVNYFYNDGTISDIVLAKAGQYSENVYFGKPCGLMDQMASSVGSLITIDFKDEEKPQIDSLKFDLNDVDYSLCIVDTLGSHANLTDDYAAIPREMKLVANHFKKQFIREVCLDEIMSDLANLRTVAGDRAVLRAIHVIEENKRVDIAVKALKDNDFKTFKQAIKSSGDSSFKYLQNVYSPSNPIQQAVSLGLCVSEMLLDEGVCRVHGGGFAGTIQAFVSNNNLSNYKAGIEKVFGEGTCNVLKIRKYGGISVI